MKGIIKIFLLFCLSALASHPGYGKSFNSDDFVNDRLFEQLECEVVELPNYRLIDSVTLVGDRVYTIEIRLHNQSDVRKLLWFRNNEEITGWPSRECHFRDVINFVAEYDGGTLRVENVENYIGTMFCNWFTSIEPQQGFTIFIQSKDKEKIKEAFKMIRVGRYGNKSIGTKDLNYEGDVVVISL